MDLPSIPPSFFLLESFSLYKPSTVLACLRSSNMHWFNSFISLCLLPHVSFSLPQDIRRQESRPDRISVPPDSSSSTPDSRSPLNTGKHVAIGVGMLLGTLFAANSAHNGVNRMLNTRHGQTLKQLETLEEIIPRTSPQYWCMRSCLFSQVGVREEKGPTFFFSLFILKRGNHANHNGFHTLLLLDSIPLHRPRKLQHFPRRLRVLPNRLWSRRSLLHSFPQEGEDEPPCWCEVVGRKEDGSGIEQICRSSRRHNQRPRG